ncbi:MULTISPECIES: N-acetyltransferase DgcN [Nisaea]|uniref:N-acetyltransferase DgcN n=1 Tax=Nisaea TaxID=390876 RepID=UPI000427586E|nr:MULTISPECIES: N-acetyltransferase DgcN [Nisaea]
MEIRNPYLMFLGDAPDQLAAKTANGVKVWREDWCVGQFRLPGCKADLKLPDMTIEEAAEAGVKTVILGVANRGGFMPDTWLVELEKALDLGMEIASGLHTRISTIPSLAAKAKEKGLGLYDVRHPTGNFSVANGKKRTGKRLLPVGTDCSVGKMFTALAIERELHNRDVKATFRATGQTGIFIAGSGVSVDAVVADFISGAVEELAPANDADHWDLVEGQGSLFHASYAGVTMGLIHGAQPDALVLCHEANRPHMRGLPEYSVPSLTECIPYYLQAARLTNPDAQFVGVCVNTSSLDDKAAEEFLKKASDETGLPAVDPIRNGVGAIVDNMPL